jgi:phosphonate transport system substrate-binding protein
MRIRAFAVLALVSASFALLTACKGKENAAEAARKTPVLRYTAIPDQNSTELEAKFRPLSDYLSKTLGVPVEYVPMRDYQAAVESFKNGDVLLAWYGGLTGVQARNAVPGSRAIAQGDVDPTYYSYFIANAATGLRRSETLPKDIAKYKFTFGSESSTSGRLMPEYFLHQLTGKTARELFRTPPGFSGSHDKTAELVASGQYEIGVINYKVYERRVKEGKTDPNVCRIIWKTPSYTDYNWTAHPDLETAFGRGFTDRLQKALLEINDPKLLAALPRDRLVPARNEDYERIREIAQQLGMLR